jgi:hypothetical protein
VQAAWPVLCITTYGTQMVNNALNIIVAPWMFSNRPPRNSDAGYSWFMGVRSPTRKA